MAMVIQKSKAHVSIGAKHTSISSCTLLNIVTQAVLWLKPYVDWPQPYFLKWSEVQKISFSDVRCYQK